jgi:guanylate kinase
MKLGPLIIVSGPAGAGKSTLIHRVIAANRFPLRLAVSATTRPPREGEEDGKDYFFWRQERFEAGLKSGAFLEYAVVHGQHYYGTPRSEVDGYREKGIGVILDIDVQGARQVRKLYPEHLSIFIKLSSWEMYEERLRKRGSETEQSIARRLETARKEVACIGEYQHVICNDDLEAATQQFLALLGCCFSDSGKG